jgi:glycosyltransferase 2 family protein
VHRSFRYIPHLLVILFAGWCAYALSADLKQVSLAPALRSWDLFLLAAVLSLLNYVFRIVRWRWYLARLGYRLPLRFAGLTFVAGFAYTLSPGKVGEMVRARYYLPLGIPLSRVAGAFFAERLLDLVAMIALAALLLTELPAYRSSILVAIALVAVGLAMLAFVPWQKVETRVSNRATLPAFIRTGLVAVSKTLAATQPLLAPVPLAVGFVLGLLAWLLEGVGLHVLSGTFTGPSIDLAGAIGVYAVAVLVGALSFLPGGLGSTEAVMSALLVTRGFSLGDAVFVTLACRIVTLWLAVVLGWIAVLTLRQVRLTPSVTWS